MPTLPHKIVANKKLESFLSARTFLAALLPLLASTSSCSRLSEKKAKFKPEKMADCEIQNAMALLNSCYCYQSSGYFRWIGITFLKQQ